MLSHNSPLEPRRTGDFPCNCWGKKIQLGSGLLQYKEPQTSRWCIQQSAAPCTRAGLCSATAPTCKGLSILQRGQVESQGCRNQTALAPGGGQDKKKDVAAIRSASPLGDHASGMERKEQPPPLRCSARAGQAQVCLPRCTKLVRKSPVPRNHPSGAWKKGSAISHR